MHLLYFSTFCFGNLTRNPLDCKSDLFDHKVQKMGNFQLKMTKFPCFPTLGIKIHISQLQTNPTPQRKLATSLQSFVKFPLKISNSPNDKLDATLTPSVTFKNLSDVMSHKTKQHDVTIDLGHVIT